MCYVILGGISAAVTTPLDVAKTRIMLANRTLISSDLKILNVLHGVYLQNGFSGYCGNFLSLKLIMSNIVSFILWKNKILLF